MNIKISNIAICIISLLNLYVNKMGYKNKCDLVSLEYFLILFILNDR